MKILITGANGFLGKNLVANLSRVSGIKLFFQNNGDKPAELIEKISQADCIIHLAGVNRPSDVSEFDNTNVGVTKLICEHAQATGKKIPILFTSSVQVDSDNSYGDSKLRAEYILKKYSLESKSTVIIYRLPNIFGKWCKPNYNSVVATFCHNISRNIPINIHDPNALVHLMYVDDFVTSVKLDIDNLDHINDVHYPAINNVTEISVQNLKNMISSFKDIENGSVVGSVGVGFQRALFATYISNLPCEKFTNNIHIHSDERGSFAEILKTEFSGQFSYFKARPGFERGGHYHDSKIEKFLVIKGSAVFRFRNVITNEYLEIESHEGCGTIVTTIPGWAHSVLNIGNDELIVFLWANEIFNNNKPDTYRYKV